MKKIFVIGWKDLILLFRDRSALILMLGAPFVLTIGLGLVTGAFSDNNTGTGLADIPVVIINQDDGELGQALADTFGAPDLADLIAVVDAADETAARALVDDDAVAAAVIIPRGFSASIIPENMQTLELGEEAPIEIIANPARPISASVVESIVQAFVSRVETGVATVEVAMIGLIQSGSVSLSEVDRLAAISQEIGERQLAALAADDTAVIAIERETAAAGSETDFNSLAYFAPGLAITFLMYTVSLGGRSFLAERDNGTMARLLSTPTGTLQVLGGKVFGIFLSGAAQVGVLVGASTLFFQLDWGNPAGVILLILATAAAGTGWGMLLAAVARTPGQVTSYGSALMLLFGVLGGGFVALPREGIMDLISKITPNAWGIDGFLALYGGATVADILPELLALVIMGAVLFATASLLFSRRAESILS